MAKELYMEDINIMSAKVCEAVGEHLKNRFPQLKHIGTFDKVLENDCFEIIAEVLETELGVADYKHYN